MQRRGHAYTPEDMILLPGVVDGLSALKNFRFFIVSSQSGIGRGHTTHEIVQECNERLIQALAKEGIMIDDVVYCPHTPEDNCECRKPKTKMWETLKNRHGLVATDCVMVGDREHDIVFGQSIGCRTALVDNDTVAGPPPTWRIASLRELPALLASAVS